MKKMMLAFMLILLFQATTATAEASLTLWEPQGNIVCFSSNGKMGIQDLDGAVLCDAIYDYIGYFDEYGLAEIRIGDRKGKIRMDGEVVVPPIHCNSIGFLQYQHTGYTEVYDEVFPVENEDAFTVGKLIAKHEGILVGISSGAAVWAAIELAKRPENKGKTIVALLPDSGDRYYSTPLFME